jgi:hypothetical protein
MPQLGDAPSGPGKPSDWVWVIWASRASCLLGSSCVTFAANWCYKNSLKRQYIALCGLCSALRSYCQN